MRTTLRRVAAFATPVLAFSLAVSAQPSYADPTPSTATAGTWLAGQLTGGVVHNNQYDFDDYGLTADFGLAFAGIGGQPTALQAVSSAMATHVHDYTEPGFGTDISAGGTAKVLRLAQVSGADPHSFGGVDLVARLESLTATNGRIADDLTTPTDTDYANVIGQSYAVEGLTVAGSPKAAAAAGFLLAQQCSAGWFRLGFSPAASPDQSCNGASPAATADTDVTALAVLALQSRRTDPVVDQAITKAVAWLTSVQQTDGSFGGGTATDTPNTNSTGLAAAALGSACSVTASERAANWVRGLQVAAGQTGPLASSVGAIAYDPAAKAAGQTDGITTPTADQWRRATSQAALGLVWDGTAPATVEVSAPKHFVKGGDTATVTITGAAAGERVCVEDTRGGHATLTGTGGPLTYTARTARKDETTLGIKATTGPGWAYGFVHALGREKLRPRLPATVERGHKAGVRVKGLGAHEKVKLYVDGNRVAKGRANAKGVFRGHFAARFARGKHQLEVVGQFKNRTGVATFRVVG